MRRASFRTWCAALWAVVALAGVGARPAAAGWVEARDDGTTVIHLTLSPDVLTDPSQTDTFPRAEIAGVREFKRRFPQIFAKRYRDRYKADPAKYGKYNWDKVEIELKRSSGISVEGVENDLLAIAGGVAPDVLYVNFRKSDTYIRNRFLYPLNNPEDSYIGDLSRAKITKKGIQRPPGSFKGGMTDEELNFRVNPTIWPVMWRKGPDGEKNVWAMPWGGAVGKVLLYRKDLFDEHGIPYPTAEWTWDDLYDACKKMTDPKRGIYGFKLGLGKHESWWWMTFLWSAGGEAMVYNEEKDEWRCVFDSPEAAKALDFYTRLSAERWVDQDGKTRRGYAYKEAQGGTKWDNGEIAMRFDYIDEKVFSKINPEVTGMAPVPLGPPDANGKRIRGAELNSRMMGIFGGVKNPVVRDAAWEYIRWYECADAVRVKTRVMVEGGLGRFINPKYLRKFGYPEVERLAPKGWSEIFDIAIATGKAEPYGRNSNIAYDMMTFPIQKAEARMRNDLFSEDEGKRLEQMRELLVAANARANDEMIGIVTPRERLWRNIVAVIVLVGIVIGFGLVFRKVIRAFTPPAATMLAEGQIKWGFRKYAWAYLLLVPAVLTVLVWRYVPLARGSIMAFQDYRLVGHSTWVWVENFGNLLWNNVWWQAVVNTGRYSLLVISLTFMPPIILAILLQEVPRGKILFRTIYYLPAVIAGLVMTLLWREFYDPTETGALNAIILKIPAVGFLILGVALLAVALLFARRMWYHGMELAAWVFTLAGVALFLTCGGLAGPIFFRPGEKLSLVLPAMLYVAFGGVLLAVAIALVCRMWVDRAARCDRLIVMAAVTVLLACGVLGLLQHLSQAGETAGSGDPALIATSRAPLLWLAWGGALLAVAMVAARRLARRERATAARRVALAGPVALVGCAAVPLVAKFGQPLVESLALFARRIFEVTPEPYAWLTNPNTAMLAIVIPMVWAGMGPGCLIYLAALKGIADDYYEAADVDGATFIDKILFLVFPILKPLILINFIGVFIASFYGSTASILVMTAGGANTETAGLHIFYKAFVFLKFGPATAMAWVLAFMLIGFTVHQLRILSRLEFRTTGQKK